MTFKSFELWLWNVGCLVVWEVPAARRVQKEQRHPQTPEAASHNLGFTVFWSTRRSLQPCFTLWISAVTELRNVALNCQFVVLSSSSLCLFLKLSSYKYVTKDRLTAQVMLQTQDGLVTHSTALQMGMWKTNLMHLPHLIKLKAKMIKLCWSTRSGMRGLVFWHQAHHRTAFATI